MDATTLRRTLVGAAVGGALFGGVAVYRSLTAGGDLTGYLGPVGFMAVLGATVGALAGPLAGRAVARLRRSGGEESPDDGGTERVEGGRQPLWITLAAGLAVGWGVGSAWGRVWVGLAFGVALSLAARRVFR